MLGRKLALIIVALVGLAITALELAAARLLAPFFGSTIFVYGSAIGIVLAALALGYGLGGRYADRYPRRAVLSSIILLAGLSAAVIPLLYRPVAQAIDAFGAPRGVPVGLLVVVAMTVLFAVPVLALGAVSPFVLRLSLRDLSESGRWSGLLSGLSTFGSIVGTFLATFVTIPLLGTRLTIVGAAAILLVLGVMLAPFGRTARLLPVFLFLPLAAAGLSGPFLSRPGLAWERESPYQLVQVLHYRDATYLVTDAADGIQSVYRAASAYTQTYYDSFALLPFLAEGEEQQRSVLVLGLAGGSMVRLYQETLTDQFSFETVGVEIDQRVLEAARAHFALDRLDLTVVADDARRYLARTDRRFDVIIVDAYVHELQIPPLLATREFFADLRRHLAPGGIVGMNVAVLSGSRFYPKFLQTVADVFPDVRHAPFAAGAANHLVLAAETVALDRLPRTIAPEIDRFLSHTVPALRLVERTAETVYTDDRTDLELLMANPHG
ncbi:MAG: fused MFS/spermidine synthase [Candidatus Kerfeldbacteria bacterium]|nr:fused MFS/spermidine synthase [Candidatus Kerfeldbacteria bacterium]